MRRYKIVLGDKSHFKIAPEWAKHVIRFNGNIYFTENAQPKPFDKYARFHEPHVQGNLNEHMFKSSEHSFELLASRVDVEESVWNGEDEPLVGQICSLAAPSGKYEIGTPVIVSGILNLFHARMIAVQPFNADKEFIALELDKLAIFESEKEKKKKKALAAIAKVLKVDTDSKTVQDLYYAMRRGEIEV